MACIGVEGASFQRLVSSSTVMMQSLGKNTRIRMSQILDRTEDSSMVRRTRIICTMGPSCWNVDKIVEMMDAGMNVCRLNFSHGDHESHGRVVQNIMNAQKQRPDHKVAIMLDTKGPEIRTGLLKDHKPVQLTAGQDLKIVTDHAHVGDSSCIGCSYDKLCSSVRPGNIILVADGSISCKVKEVCDGYVMTTVMNSAVIGERKNMNLPNVKVELPCISDKDSDDILNFAIPMGCNFIAASFVQTAEDVRTIRNVLGPRGRHIRIISKIENVEGLINFDEILAESDAIMVARGDLGMEIPPEKVFLAQKMMIAKCNVAGKPVITATQMLESMTKNPRATRAEAADVANAVLDGTDCVMLSGETAGGDFPIDAVKVMTRVCIEAEMCVDYPQLHHAIRTAVPRPVSIQEAVACAAVDTAADTGAALILALTETGYTARLITKYRPQQLVLALSASESTVRHLEIARGILPLLVQSFQGTDQVIFSALAVAKERGLVLSGQSVVVVHGIKEEVAGSSNLMKVLDVP